MPFLGPTRRLAALLLFALAGTASAQVPRFAGDWEGPLDLGPITVRLVLHVADGAPPVVTLDSPDQGAFGFRADSVGTRGPTLTAVFAELQGRFVGTVGDSAMVGRWRQAGRDYPAVTLTRTADRPSAAPDAALAPALGTWAGTPDGLGLRLVFHFRPSAARDTLAVTLDSPDQGAVGVGPGTAVARGDGVVVAVPAAGLSFSGRVADGELRGTVRQNGAAYPVTLRPQPAARASRPQTPRPPFPYREEPVTVQSAPDVVLSGTLTLPTGDGPFPAAVLVSGSGPQDRDQTILGHKPFAVLADRLARAGIAVYRFDDRGTARSTGDFSTATLTDFATDAAAAVAALRARPDIAEVGLIGHSEGGYVAPLVAADSAAGVAFVVSLAGPAVPGREVYAEQHRRIAGTLGLSPLGTTLYGTAIDSLAAAVVADRSRADAERAFRRALAAIPGPDRVTLGYAGARADAQIGTLLDFVTTPWARAFLGYAPRPALRALRMPTLMLFGGRDVQVPSDQSATAARAALVANRRARIVVVDDANHLFQTAPTGAIEEYGQIEETLAEPTLDLIVRWVQGAVGVVGG